MREKFERWHTLFVQYSKRDWKKVLVWILGLGLFSGAFIPAFEEIAKGEGQLGMFETLQNPAMTAMVGPTPVETASDYTLGAMYAHEMLLFCGLFAMIISVLHVISHTRKEEDLGLTELVRSYQVGRQANSLATLMQTVIINLVLALFIAMIMLSFGAETISVEGSLLFGVSIGMAGIIGAVIALVMAQIMPSSSGATSSALGIIGLLYIVRAGTDISYAQLSFINPVGWIYSTYPYTENNWLPTVFGIIFALVVVMIAFALEGARDMGAGYFPEREGRGEAKKSLLSVHGLLIRINRGVIISWFIAFVILGASYGSIYGDMQSFVEGNELMKLMFSHSDVSIEQSFTGTIMMVMISLVAILPIALVNRLFAEESRSHLSQLFATKVSRGQWYWTNIGLAIVAGSVGILLAAGGLGSAAMATMGDHPSMSMSDFLAAGYNLLPIVLFLISLAALALGWAPSLGKAVYVYLTYSFFLNYFSGLLELPDWFLRTAIQNWMPQMPMEQFSALAFVMITVVSSGLMVLGYVGYSKRDMYES